MKSIVSGGAMLISSLNSGELFSIGYFQARDICALGQPTGILFYVNMDNFCYAKKAIIHYHRIDAFCCEQR